MDWAAVVGAARALRTQPLVDFTMEGLETEWDIPREARKALWLDAQAWRRWNDRLVDGGGEVLDALRNRGYRVVPFKGFDYARRLYPHARLRPMVDIDLLFPAEMLGPACEFLKRGLGFLEQEGEAERRHARFYHKRILARGERRASVCLDVHSVFYHPHLYPVDYAELWSRVRADDRGLSSEDCLLLSCMTLAKDRYQAGLRDVVDVHEILCRWEPDWTVVLGRARKWGMSVALFYSLLVARGVLESPVPDWILEECRPGWFRRTWLRLFLRTEGIPVYRFDHGEWLPKVFLRLPLADSVRSGARFLVAFARR